MKAVLSFMLLCFGVCFAQNHSAYQNNDQVIDYLVESQDTTVIQETDDAKVYLNTDKILVKENGVFLEVRNGALLPIPFLSSDQRGCYIASSKIRNFTVYPIIRCRNCNQPFHPSIINQGVCPHCGYQN